MNCNACPRIGYMQDAWDEELVRVICSALGTAAALPNPDKIEEYDFDIKAHEFDLGKKNAYCPYHEPPRTSDGRYIETCAPGYGEPFWAAGNTRG